MLAIIAHHYVVNSGLIGLIAKTPDLTVNSIFLLLFGSLGKTGINCFLLITGYFMSTSKMTMKKFLKLFLEIEFYKIVITLIFLFSGYRTYSFKELFVALTPFYGIGRWYTPSIVSFFLFIPFLNILIHAMDEKMHLRLIGLCLFIFTILPSFIIYPLFVAAEVRYGDLEWFPVVYLIAAYLRLYPKPWFERRKEWGISALVSLFLLFGSVIAMAYVAREFGIKNAWYPYYFAADSNKILALTTAVCLFIFFKNWRGFHSELVNKIAASVFGVLLIHTIGATMIKWLWKDTLNNVGYYGADLSVLALHAVYSVAGVYIVCTLLDMLRIKFIEIPFFKWYDDRAAGKRPL